MKSTIIIEIETNNMIDICDNENNKNIKDQFEKEMHKEFKEVIKNYFSDDNFEQEYFELSESGIIEDNYEFDNYTDIVITVDNEEVKNITRRDESNSSFEDKDNEDEPEEH